ncbi:hypothetical protein HDU79_010049 [Rhizoclosmatium sp. JEL0117]|nr:hypothetical protein HDU79_010049 [Rhizoclosmatium sp. JEL0117]
MKPLSIIKTTSATANTLHRDQSVTLTIDEQSYSGSTNHRRFGGSDPDDNKNSKYAALNKGNEGGSIREVVFAVSFYITTALVMVLVNKAVLNTVPLPITFLWIQILVAVLLLWNSSLLGLLKLPTLTAQNCSKVMPLIFINVIGLTLNTLCLQYVDASFYQVARALVLPFTVILSRVCLKQTISASVLSSCVLVFFGFLLGTVFEGPAIVVSVLGTTLGVASSVSTAVHAIVIKTSLGAVNGNTIDLVYYNNVLSLVMLAPVVLFSGEVSKVLDIIELAWTGALANESLLTTDDAEKQLFALVVGGFVTGIFGFLINVAGFFQIKVTSPLSHMISSAFRGV